LTWCGVWDSLVQTKDLRILRLDRWAKERANKACVAPAAFVMAFDIDVEALRPW